MAQRTEAQMLEEIQNRESPALEEAISRYGGLVYTVIQRSMGSAFSPEDGEELSSDVFLALWEQAGSIRPEKLKSWLAAVARNKALSACRKRRTLLPLDELEIPVEDRLWETLSQDEQRGAIRRVLDTLSPQERALIVGYYYYEKPFRVLAQELGISPSAAKVRLYRLRKKLKLKFEERGIS